MYNYRDIHYIHFDVIDSTNTWAKNQAHLLDSTRVSCITASEQTSGRGRFSRSWISPKGQNIYATIFFCLPLDCSYLLNVGQILALSCIKVLKNKGFSALIKWPNDILLEGKKLAGILCETVRFSDRIAIVLGIGINVNMTNEFLDTIDQPATSLLQVSGHSWSLKEILDPILQEFLDFLQILDGQGFRAFHTQMNDLLAYKGQMITCQDQGKSIQGICHSIDQEGRLILVRHSNEVHSIPQPIIIHSGEIKNG